MTKMASTGSLQYLEQSEQNEVAEPKIQSVIEMARSMLNAVNC